MWPIVLTGYIMSSDNHCRMEIIPQQTSWRWKLSDYGPRKKYRLTLWRNWRFVPIKRTRGAGAFFSRLNCRMIIIYSFYHHIQSLFKSPTLFLNRSYPTFPFFNCFIVFCSIYILIVRLLFYFRFLPVDTTATWKTTFFQSLKLQSQYSFYLANK